MGRDHLGDPDVDGRIDNIKIFLEKQGDTMGIGLT
jgi:hypothetical protein